MYIYTYIWISTNIVLHMSIGINIKWNDIVIISCDYGSSHMNYCMLWVASPLCFKPVYRVEVHLVHCHLTVTSEENQNNKVNQEELLIFLFFPLVILNHKFGKPPFILQQNRFSGYLYIIGFFCQHLQWS